MVMIDIRLMYLCIKFTILQAQVVQLLVKLGPKFLEMGLQEDLWEVWIKNLAKKLTKNNTWIHMLICYHKAIQWYQAVHLHHPWCLLWDKTHLNRTCNRCNNKCLLKINTTNHNHKVTVNKEEFNFLLLNNKINFTEMDQVGKPLTNNNSNKISINNHKLWITMHKVVRDPNFIDWANINFKNLWP